MSNKLKPSNGLKPNRGFTLIEIICVVILLGIISAIGVHR